MRFFIKSDFWRSSKGTDLGGNANIQKGIPLSLGLLVTGSDETIDTAWEHVSDPSVSGFTAGLYGLRLQFRP